jgi:hypothetical protein
MKISILIHKTFDIPDKKISGLSRAVRWNLGLTKNDDVQLEDLLREAENKGLIQLPDEDWEVNQ